MARASASPLKLLHRQRWRRTGNCETAEVDGESVIIMFRAVGYGFALEQASKLKVGQHIDLPLAYGTIVYTRLS